MKSLIKICFIIFMCSLSSQLKLKKSETMMEFYNSLFNRNWAQSSTESNSNNELQNLKIKNKSKSHSKVNSEAENLFKTNSHKKSLSRKEDDATPPEKPQGPDAPVFTGNLKISSKLFKVPSLFPPIRVVNESGAEQTLEIIVDKEDYRINQKNGDGKTDERDFYFTLTKNHLFYTVEEKDVNVLQTFVVEDYKIQELAPEWQMDGTPLFCFELKQKMTNYNYKICSKDKPTVSKLMCAYADLIKYEINSCNLNEIPGVEKQTNNIPPTPIKETIEEATILVPLPSKTCNDSWNYQNHGEDWECQCKEGLMQSPIDLPDPKEAILSPVTPLFQFDEVNAKSTITTIDGEIKANEYIRMKYSDGALRILHHNLGKIVTLNGAVYIAEEITVHTPSEHTIKGKRLDMEIQISFYGQSKGDIAKQVVLSFLFEKKAGYYNKFLDDLDFYNLPNQHYTEKEIVNNIFIPKILYSVNGDSLDELPVMKPFSFYTYDGSLTMPPCSEDTIHYVAAEPIPVGSVVLDLAREALKIPDMEERDSETGEKKRLSDFNTYENFRNTQNLNNRSVFYFDHKRYCGASINNIIPRQTRGKGHYEKIKRKVEEFIYVPGQAPSHIPGAFVVSEKESKGIEEKVEDKTE